MRNGRIPLPLDNRRTVVVGAGVAGLAAAELLVARGASVRIIDDGDKERVQERVSAYSLDTSIVVDFANIDFGDVEFVVLSPGVPRTHAAVVAALERGVPVVDETELAYALSERPPVIAVTGTNGKSTTVALLARFLVEDGRKVFLGGNYGRPYCRALTDGEAHDVVVLELSSYQLETIEDLSLDCAVITNLMPDHLDRYRDVADYYRTKVSIVDLVKVGGTVCLNADDDNSRDFLATEDDRVRLFGRAIADRAGVGIDGTDIAVSGERQARYAVKNPALNSRVNLENAAAAVCAALSIDVEAGAIEAGLAGFEGLAHRLEIVSKHNGVVFVDDSKATNVAAAAAALRSQVGRVHLIAGGVAKDEPLTPLLRAAASSVVAWYLIGRDAERFAQEVSTVPVHICGNLEAAVAAAAEAAVAGDVVLLSPACASFDQFRNFQERGMKFREAVSALSAKEAS